MKRNLANLSDEDLSAELSGTSTGPATWRGKPLHPLKRGLLDMATRIISGADTVAFHDVAILTILSRVYGETPDQSFANRKELLSEISADIDTFKAALSISLDDLTDADLEEARAIVARIFSDPEPVAPAPPVKTKAKKKKR